MNSLDFFNHLVENLGTYFLIWSLCFFTYCIALRKCYFSIFDPLFVTIFFTSFSSSVVVYLFCFGLIDRRYFFSFCITEACLVLGIYATGRLIQEPVCFSKKEEFSLKSTYAAIYLYSFVFTVFLIAQAITYLKFGIPLFLTSRLTTYSGSGGYGILGRLLTAYTNVLIYFYIIFSFYLKEFQGPFLHFLNRATLVVLFVSFIFSGSKSALLSVVFVFYSVQFYFSSIFPEKVAQADRKFKGLLPLVLILGVIGAFFTLGIQRKVTDGFEIAGLLAERMVATGDVFFMAYPHGVIEKVKQKTDIFTATFVDFLAMTRMISSSEAPEPIGFALTAYHYGPMPFGPNPRHNILGYLYLGDYAFAYSFVLGCIIGLFRNNRLVCFKRGYLFRLIHFLFFVQVRTIWSDPPLAVAHINGILFFLLPPLLFSLILSHITLKYNRQPKFFLSKPRSVI